MKMHVNRVRFCRTCHDALNEQGAILLKSYIDICTQYVLGQQCLAKSGLNGAGSTLINYLEKHSYVVTTESDEDILSIKPCGHIYDLDDEVHEFCANRKVHLKTGEES